MPDLEQERNSKFLRIMSCGCVEDGTFTLNGKTSFGCTMHHSATPMIPQPDLANRLAQCCYGCKSTITRSRVTLPFFKFKPMRPYDEYYCSCYGWD